MIHSSPTTMKVNIRYLYHWGVGPAGLLLRRFSFRALAALAFFMRALSALFGARALVSGLSGDSGTGPPWGRLRLRRGPLGILQAPPTRRGAASLAGLWFW